MKATDMEPPDEPCPDCGSTHHRSCEGKTLMTASNPLDVKTLRKGLGLTQGELARALNISQRTVRRWEQGDGINLIWQERLSDMWRERFPSVEPPQLAKGAASGQA